MNVEELRSLMVEMNPDETKPITDDTLIWFVCIQRARPLCEDGVRDLAELLRDGIEPINKLEDVQTYLDDCLEDFGNEQDTSEFIIESLEQFLGKKEPIVTPLDSIIDFDEGK